MDRVNVRPPRCTAERCRCDPLRAPPTSWERPNAAAFSGNPADSFPQAFEEGPSSDGALAGPLFDAMEALRGVASRFLSAPFTLCGLRE